MLKSPFSEVSLDQSESEEQGFEVVETFKDMQLREELLRGIYASDFRKPSPLQQCAILPAVRGCDVIVQVQSGEPATFVIPILELIDTRNPQCQAIILTPLPEYASKIQKLVLDLGQFMKVKCHACVGGTGDDTATSAHVVVGTPTQVLDIISNRRALRTDAIKMFVLDEVDQLLSHSFKDQAYDIFRFLLPKALKLSHGFKDQVYDIYRPLAPYVQVFLLSTTVSQEILDAANKFVRDPICIFVKRNKCTIKGSKQFYLAVEREEWKPEALCSLYKTVTDTQAVIFCNTHQMVDRLTAEMSKREFNVSAMHEEMEQVQRELTMKEFCSGSSLILITTDLFARCLEVHKVSVIINYDLPNRKEKYVHRIINCGRFGRKGVAINLVTGTDYRMLRDIEHLYNIQVKELPPSFADLL